jgi:hypothetical protein
LATVDKTQAPISRNAKEAKMKKQTAPMTLSKLEARLSKLRAKHGDIEVVIDDMEPVTPNDLMLIDGVEPERIGRKFLHIGNF